MGRTPFTSGKTVRIIVGASAGGGYDTYSRTIARHMGKHIPGNPAIVVDNMPGAGFLISANHMYRIAKPDGLTIGHFIGGLFLQQLLGKPGIEFDARKFEYMGVPAQDNYMLAAHKSTGITSIEQWLSSKTPVKLGGVGVGSATDDIPKVLAATIGLPMQLVSGYKGTADVRLAFNSQEILGVCNAWESFKATWRKELDAGEAVIVLSEYRQTPSGAAQAAAGDQLRQERRGAKAHPRPGPQRRPHRAALRAASGHAQGSRADSPQGVYRDGERCGFSRRRQQSETRHQPARRRRVGEKRQGSIQSRSQTDTPSQGNFEVKATSR